MGQNLQLKIARVSRGYNQSDLAKVIEKTVGAYSDKERGEVAFSLEEVVQISVALNLTYDEFNAIFFSSKLPFGNLQAK